MELSIREIWTVLHGMVLGAVFLLAFGGAIADLYELKASWITPEGAMENSRRLKLGLWAMALIAWGTVITGTWVVYVWYRAKPVAGTELFNFPRYFLLSKPNTKEWHEFGMEWKEHVAWIAPMLLTSIAYSAQYYGERIKDFPRMRRTLFWLLIITFASAAVAGLFGAFINKVAATR